MGKLVSGPLGMEIGTELNGTPGCFGGQGSPLQARSLWSVVARGMISQGQLNEVLGGAGDPAQASILSRCVSFCSLHLACPSPAQTPPDPGGGKLGPGDLRPRSLSSGLILAPGRLSAAASVQGQLLEEGGDSH